MLKVIVLSGESNERKIIKLGSAVLGIPYNPTDDTIAIQFNLKFDVLHSNIGSNPFDSLSSTFLNNYITTLSMRNLLSIMNGIFDPLGLTVRPSNTVHHQSGCCFSRFISNQASS